MAQYEFARTEEGIIHIEKAEPHKKYLCADEGCNSLLIPVFGEVGREPHFRHEIITDFHAGETPLHFNTKHLIAEKLRIAIRDYQPIYYFYGKNLIENVVNLSEVFVCNPVINIEKSVSKEYRPDISVINEGVCVLSIEIIYSHELDKGALEYILKNKIMVIKIYITDILYQKLLHNNGLWFKANDPDYQILNYRSYFIIPFKLYVDDGFWRVKKRPIPIPINKHEIRLTLEDFLDTHPDAYLIIERLKYEAER